MLHYRVPATGATKLLAFKPAKDNIPPSSFNLLEGPAMQPQAATPTRSSFFTRRELFCQHFAAGAGGAEAVRRSGYSPNGAKQRAHVLLTQPEIRLRIEALRAERRAERRAEHQRHLADAIAVVDGVIADAAQHSKSSVVLRAVELKLKLHGVIRDKRIDFYSYDTPSPDADLEN